MPKHKAMAPLESFQAFGDLLVYLRKRARLTQEELGRAVGYSRTQITLLEKNRRSPSVTTVRALFVPALELDESPEWAQRLIDLATEKRKPRTNLPTAVNVLIGREHEAAEVCGILRIPDRRLVTLTGPPGIGKTRLSLQVAGDLLADFTDGVFFVPLAALEDPNLVAPAILQTLGFAQTEQRPPLEHLIESLNARQMLLVLDNFEHIIAAAPLVSELLAACPRLKMIVTSRESLHVSGEWQYPVPPLSTPDENQAKNLTLLDFEQFSALRLFAERARAVRFGFSLTLENVSAVAAICRQLDGLPLAIELIASRVRMLPPEALLPRLTNDFTLHVEGLRNVPDRQLTLHNAIAWSYALLSPEEQTLLRRLAVFSGGWTLSAAEMVCAGDGIETHKVESLLLRLMDKSLVITDVSAEEPRFGILETIRQYAHAKLVESGESERVKTGHLGFYLQFSETADQNLFSATQAIWLSRLDMEYSNLRAALAWAETSRQAEMEMLLTVALGYFWYIRLYMKDGSMWLERALKAHATHGGGPNRLQAKTLLWLSEMERLQSNFPAAWTYANESRRLAQTLGDQAGLAEVLRVMSGIALAEKRYSEARLLLEESLVLQQAVGTPHLVAWILNGLGEVARAQADFVSAESYYGQALELFRSAGDEFRSSTLLLNLGFVALQQGNHVQAQERLQESLNIARKLNDLGNIEGCLIGFAGLIAGKGNLACAVRILSAIDAAIKVYGGQLDSPDRAVYERILVEVHAQLDDTVFDGTWSEGQQLTIEQAIEVALSEMN